MIRRYIVLFLLLFSLAAGVQAAKPAPIYVLRIEGQIDPAMADYVHDGMIQAQSSGAQAALIIINTPGGLITSMQKIIGSIFASKIPVIVYVYPENAWAASAGAIITMSADVAAMSPGASIGASTPVNIGPGGESGKEDETMKHKQVNFTAAYARSIAEKRGRNVQWADAAVRSASSLSANEALGKHVIDFVATGIPDLMQKVNGRTIKLSTGKNVVLQTANAPLKEVPMGFLEMFLHILSNPYVTLFLTMAAMYGIIYELANPGSIFPGVVGAISVLLLLYSYSVIPVNAAGFAFIALAILLFGIELFTPTHGVLTVGGIASMFMGLMMLFRSAEGFMVSIWTIVIVAIGTGAFFFFLIGLGVRSLKKPYLSGREGVVGHVGEAKTDLEPIGKVFVDGSFWTATSEDGSNIGKGESIEVTEMNGLKLKVKRRG